MTTASCELCEHAGGEVLVSNEHLRVVLVDEPAYPGFCRVIWNTHVREMSDLPDHDRLRILDAVMRVERAIRYVLEPDKVNLASLGNVTPHVHWHVIPRWRDDACFPQPIWAQATRPQARPSVTQASIDELKTALHAAFAQEGTAA